MRLERYKTKEVKIMKDEHLNEFIENVMQQIENYCIEKDARPEQKHSLIRRFINRCWSFQEELHDKGE